LEAARKVRRYVQSHEELLEDAKRGKMFGVLIVDDRTDTSFLAAYSGLLAGRNDWSWFVPPVFDAQQPDGHFKQTERQITAINVLLEKMDAIDPLAIELKERRKWMSEDLQLWLFQQYRMLNAYGEERDLLEIWHDYHSQKVRKKFPYPPGGTGDCCAPKLLQYAYQQGWKPLCMAEFWMGASPKAEVRHDGQFYPACRGKCLPILTWMLRGLDVEDNPQESDSTLYPLGTTPVNLDIRYEDQWLMVINKPTGLLSVPGRESRLSVWSIIRQHYADSDDWALAHRLDMGTSGLLIITKTREAYALMQEQFAARKVQKTYIALLNGVPKESHGTISLPMKADPLDRPRQVVDEENGKTAVTDYEVLSVKDGITRIELHPHTGRTHQLRVHCAHEQGLGIPILGDDLYGTKADRMYLHAQEITFCHPITREQMTLRCEAPF
jgi:tRNA pseudouridine32 synthase/23S rRNA pseudouridine746 synthase